LSLGVQSRELSRRHGTPQVLDIGFLLSNESDKVIDGRTRASLMALNLLLLLLLLEGAGIGRPSSPLLLWRRHFDFSNLLKETFTFEYFNCFISDFHEINMYSHKAITGDQPAWDFMLLISLHL
jgi:hypothetical protein